MRYLIFLSVLLLITGCAPKTKPQPKQSPAPDWVLGQSALFGESQFLTGRGSGATQVLAADRARADLIKTLSVTIESTLQSRQEVSGDQYESRVSQAVVSRASRTIEGVEIADRWYDGKHDLHYALAVLDRAKSAARIDTQIARLDREMAALEQEADTQSDSLLALRALQEASETLKMREAQNALLALLRVQANPAYAGADALQKKHREAVASLGLVVTGRPDALKPVVAALDRAGFVAGPRSKAAFEIKATLDGQNVLYDGWHWSTQTLAIELVELGTNRIRGHWRIEAKASATLPSEAQARAEQALAEKTARQLPGFLTGAKE